MIENKISDQRSFVRASLSFRVEFKVMSREEYEKTRSTGNKLHAADEKKLIFEPADADERGIAADKCLVDFLVHIDQKLDLILNALSHKELGVDLPNRGVGIDIGGAGMKILSESYVEPGLIVTMSLFLSRSPLTYIDLAGEVVRSEPACGREKDIYQLGIKFLDLDINDREKIISCVFKSQREEIRRSNRDSG